MSYEASKIFPTDPVEDDELSESVKQEGFATGSVLPAGELNRLHADNQKEHEKIQEGFGKIQTEIKEATAKTVITKSNDTYMPKLLALVLVDVRGSNNKDYGYHVTSIFHSVLWRDNTTIAVTSSLDRCSIDAWLRNDPTIKNNPKPANDNYSPHSDSSGALVSLDSQVIANSSYSYQLLNSTNKFKKYIGYSDYSIGTSNNNFIRGFTYYANAHNGGGGQSAIRSVSYGIPNIARKYQENVDTNVTNLDGDYLVGTAQIMPLYYPIEYEETT